MRKIRRLRRWVRTNRRSIVVGLITFVSALAILNVLGSIGQVRDIGPRNTGGSDLMVVGQEITPEQHDYFRRSSPLEQQRILQERQEKALTGPR